MIESKKAKIILLCRYFLYLGTTCFGGPVALIAAMQKDLIDEKKLFSQEEFKKGLALCQIAPGPLATQLTIYFGWLVWGWVGAAATGFFFILPSFIMVLFLAAFYIRFGSIPLIQDIFHGLSPAVIALVMIGAWKLSKKNLGTNKIAWLIAILNAGITAFSEVENLWIILFSGLIYATYQKFTDRSKMQLLSAWPLFFLSGIQGPTTWQTQKDILFYFSKAGAVVFGSGLAIVPFLHGGAVVEFHWLTEKQFIDAIAIAMITPGPIVITAVFIGFLAGGLVGSIFAALGTFLPCYFFTVLPAPYFEQWVKRVWIRDMVTGITAAAIGAIIGACYTLTRKSILDIQGIVLFGLCFFIFIRFKKIPEPLVILSAGAIGALLSVF